jgi:hypothetical protein
MRHAWCSALVALVGCSQKPNEVAPAGSSVAPAASSVAPAASSVAPAASSVAPLVRGPKTLGFTRCEAHAPSGSSLVRGDLGRVARAIAKDLCYGYFRKDVTPDKLAGSLEACAAGLGTTTFELELTFGEASTCTVLVGAIAWEGGTLARTRETYATTVPLGGGGSGFGVGIHEHVLELRGDAEPRVLAKGQPCDALRSGATGSQVVGELAPALRTAWTRMPADVRASLCGT